MNTKAIMMILSFTVFAFGYQGNIAAQEGQSSADDRALESALNEKKANFENNASDEKKQAYADGIRYVEENYMANALKEGDKAIDFELTNALKKKVKLSDELKKGPVILTWYRGGWCPYCNITLHYMQESLPEFKKYGANLIALTPELPDHSISTKEKNELQFEVLSDVDNQVAREYGIVFKLTDDVAKRYEEGFGLSDYNGNDKAELPLAATYIIDQNGVIRYAFLDADYRNRAEPADIIEVLKEL